MSVLTILLTVLDPGNIYYCDSCELIAYSFIPLYLKNCECIILYAKNEYAEKGRAVYSLSHTACIMQSRRVVVFINSWFGFLRDYSIYKSFSEVFLRIIAHEY